MMMPRRVIKRQRLMNDEYTEEEEKSGICVLTQEVATG